MVVFEDGLIEKNGLAGVRVAVHEINDYGGQKNRYAAIIEKNNSVRAFTKEIELCIANLALSQKHAFTYPNKRTRNISAGE